MEVMQSTSDYFLDGGDAGVPTTMVFDDNVF